MPDRETMNLGQFQNATKDLNPNLALYTSVYIDNKQYYNRLEVDEVVLVLPKNAEDKTYLAIKAK